MVVVVGLTLTPVLLVTSMGAGPPVMTPVPLAKTPVRVELPPFVMVAGRAPKLEIVGAGFTVTVALAVIGAPPAVGVSVRV